MSEEKEGKISDILKKAVSTGISAAFLTEDAVKNIIGDLPLPKDIINGLLQNAKESKTEFIKGIKNIKVNEVNEVIKKYLSFEKMTICVVGNYTKDEIIKSLSEQF